MALQQAGFNEFDVSELRFFCVTKHGKNPKFIHFKSRNSAVIMTAMTGDQGSLKAASWNRENEELAPPKKKEYFGALRVDLPKLASKVTNKPDGSFWATPLSDEEHYWTVKGPSKTGGKFTHFF